MDLQEDTKTVEVLRRRSTSTTSWPGRPNGETQVALDMALDKVIHQIRRYKEKIQDHRRTPSAGDGSAARPPRPAEPALSRPGDAQEFPIWR